MERTAPEVQGDLGWSLGVLLRGYRAAVTSALGDLPQGNRGYQVLATVAQHWRLRPAVEPPPDPRRGTGPSDALRLRLARRAPSPVGAG